MEKLDWRLGLKQETIPVFEAVSQMEVIKGLYLCGRVGERVRLQQHCHSIVARVVRHEAYKFA